MAIYSRPQQSDADDDDLHDRLRLSVQLVKERKRKMATKRKVSSTKQRASVGRELRLALALVALIDANRDMGNDEVVGAVEAQAKAEQDAVDTLSELGYSNIEGIPRRVARLNAQLKEALESSDGARIAALGLELQRAQAGKPPLKSPAPPAVKKSSRSSGAAKSTVSTAVETEGVGGAQETGDE